VFTCSAVFYLPSKTVPLSYFHQQSCGFAVTSLNPKIMLRKFLGFMQESIFPRRFNGNWVISLVKRTCKSLFLYAKRSKILRIVSSALNEVPIVSQSCIWFDCIQQDVTVTLREKMHRKQTDRWRYYCVDWRYYSVVCESINRDGYLKGFSLHPNF
jgi:hypothetical protein